MSSLQEEVIPSLSYESLIIVSGKLLIIDQFMLSNECFTKAASAALQAQDNDGLSQQVRKFGGELVEVVPGEYRVYRDPIELLLIVSQAKIECTDHVVFQITEEKMHGGIAALNHIFVDTRCLVFIDVNFLIDTVLLDQYVKLRGKGEDKPARDHIRAAGGAVRYGFNRLGDELGVFKVPYKNETLYCMWPDVA